MTRLLLALAATLVLAALAAAPAPADFPWRPGPDPGDYSQYRLPAGPNQAPADLSSKEQWMYAATPEPGNDPVNESAMELDGVRGAHIVDNADVPTAWQTTTGRPDVVIAVHDSGIEWDNRGAMLNVRKKIWLNKGELPVPNHDRTEALEPGVDCSTYKDQYDANGDGVFNVIDYACDTRVEKSGAARAAKGEPRGNGIDDLLDPEDIIIAFSDGTDADHNGYVDDIVGWDFLDNDNDPYDDVQYGHGTGEVQDSGAEADNGQDGVGTCPNCMEMINRVGDSFVADVNNFAQGVLYATDNGALVIQEALGTLNNSGLARAAVDYAYRHGVTVIASAADEAAQHHNWPSSYPHVIVVNSVTKYDPTFTPEPKSYLQFNGCTNFSSKITVAIPSVSCSSDATGRGSGMAGLIYSAALDGHHDGTLAAHPADGACVRPDGSACVITPNEVRQLMASGSVGGTGEADDVDWAVKELSCSPLPTPACTDPNLNAPGNWAVVSPLVETRRYPARKGFDQFYGYGRVNAQRAVANAYAGRIPPEVEITSPQWFDQVDPRQSSFPVTAQLDARGAAYTCSVEVAPGSYPNNDTTANGGDFAPVDSAWCDGTTAHRERFDGASPLAYVDIAKLRAMFPLTAGDFDGREPGIGTTQETGGRPDIEPYGFTIRVVATSVQDGVSLQGEDRRNLYLHHDQDLLPGWPKRIGGNVAGDAESTPVLADLDGDDRNELIVAGSDGLVHAYRPDGSELPGWPVATDRLPLHTGDAAFASGEVSSDVHAPILSALAVGDLDHDGIPEVVAAAMDGKVYAWEPDGTRRFVVEANPDFGGRPLQPFVPARHGKQDRTQHAFITAPVLADLDGDGRLEVIAAGMDRHLYAWHDDGTPVKGFPALVVDRSKVAAVDPVTDQVTFRTDIGEPLNQGAIVDTPAVGDLDGDGRPEIVVGTNEEYPAASDGGLNTGNVDTASLGLISQTGVLDMANSRLYAFDAGGKLLPGWPFKVPKLFAELLPVVGEGVTGSPVMAPLTCPSGGTGMKIAEIPDGGPAMVLNPDGTSCLGTDPSNGKPIAMQSDIPDGNPDRTDVLALPAVGQPAFGDFAGGTSLIAPTTGLLRALDLTVNEYQGGQDSFSAWNPTDGQFRTGFPAQVNDLSFLTGPVVGDVDGLPGQEMLGGTAYLDLQAFNAAGLPASPAWPKLTSDWMVATPVLGSFGTLDTTPSAHKDVIAAVRDGRIFAYSTPAGACSPSSWPRFHHDPANSGDFTRDAVLPGKPLDLRVALGVATLTAPGGDLMCGRADHYEIKAGGTGGWVRVNGVTPVAAGGPQTLPLPAGLSGTLFVRAVDAAGNVGRAASVKLP
ncbi:MAG TPA: FG-GAP-like repeat-containing protein [Solirubrobacteraceae bacterium]|nr:FG-GAP-like repeat-containing protein [Solirubrobacteraceae bacterium]